MKMYGSLVNRLSENKVFGEIKVGTGATMYLYSDRHAYEVIEVINQEHVVIRRMDAKRVDKNGMSECQDYEYTSNKNNHTMEIVKRNGVWMERNEYSLDVFKKRAEERDVMGNIEMTIRYFIHMSGLTENQQERILDGKVVSKYNKIQPISFGVMEEYYDFSF